MDFDFEQELIEEERMERRMEPFFEWVKDNKEYLMEIYQKMTDSDDLEEDDFMQWVSDMYRHTWRRLL